MNITILELPPRKGKTTKSIDYLVNEAIIRPMVFITFDDSIKNIKTKIEKKMLEVAPDKMGLFQKNIKFYVFNKPLDVKTFEIIIKSDKPSGIVFDGIEWFDSKKESFLDNEKEFINYASAKDVTFFVTKQSPKNLW